MREKKEYKINFTDNEVTALQGLLDFYLNNYIKTIKEEGEYHVKVHQKYEEDEPDNWVIQSLQNILHDLEELNEGEV